MNNNQYHIPLQDKSKMDIIEAVSNALSKDLATFMQDYNLATYNSVHMLKWDFTNSNLNKTFNNDEFSCYLAKRGPWKFILLFDEKNQFLYTLMKRKRFDEVQANEKNNKVHYLEALVSPNKDLLVEEENKRTFQADLFDLDNEERSKAINEIFESLTNVIGKDIKRYVLVTFEATKSLIESISAILLTSNLEIAHEEDWSNLIPAYYDNTNIIDIPDIQEEILEDDFEEIDIPIRKEVLPETEGSLDISIRKEDEESKEGEES